MFNLNISYKRKLSKRVFLLLGLSSLIMIGAVYATGTTDKVEEEITVSNNLFEKIEDTTIAEIPEEQALVLAEKYKNLVIKSNNLEISANQQKNLSLNNNNKTVELKEENITEENQTYWEINDNETKIKINSENGNLMSIMNKKESFSKSTSSKNEVEKIANDLYKDLEMNEDYSLYFIEQFDDELWTAYFAKKIDGIYNDYQSVRMTFAPADKEIIFLVVKDEIVENNKVLISKEEAEQIAKESVNCNIISNSCLQFIRPNDFFTNKNYTQHKKSNTIKKAWIILLDNKYLVYVDCSTGNIIGGDRLV